MSVETAFLEALQGTSFLDRQGQMMLLNDRQGSLVVALKRPEPEMAPSPSPSAEPTAEETSEATQEPEPTKTEAPSKTPAPTERS